MWLFRLVYIKRKGWSKVGKVGLVGWLVQPIMVWLVGWHSPGKWVQSGSNGWLVVLVGWTRIMVNVVVGMVWLVGRGRGRGWRWSWLVGQVGWLKTLVKSWLLYWLVYVGWLTWSWLVGHHGWLVVVGWSWLVGWLVGSRRWLVGHGSILVEHWSENSWVF